LDDDDFDDILSGGSGSDTNNGSNTDDSGSGTTNNESGAGDNDDTNKTDIGGKTLPDDDFGDLTPGDYGADTHNTVLTSNVQSTSSGTSSLPLH
jgi:hypothetical protein